MSLYSGMSLVAKAGAIDRVTKLSISDATCTFNFYSPPKNPKLNPTDRVVDHTYSGTFDSNQSMYIASIDTTGWIGGDWWMQAVLTVGSNTSFEYYEFTLLG
jgi:hypothetical protein